MKHNELSYDLRTEIRHTFNGEPAARQDSSVTLMVNLAWQAGLAPPAEKEDALLASFDPQALGIDKGSYRRLAMVQHCLARYRRGIAINTPLLEEKRNESLDFIASRRHSIPPGIIDQRGDIDARRLEDKLPPSIKATWPRNTYGQLRTDSNLLERLDNPYSIALLCAKREIRDWILHHLSVNANGRHQSWPNPFGTKTGRENPKGPSFIRLSRDQRAILTASDERALVNLDFQQQEPAIALFLAGEERLLQAYEQEDIYHHLAGEMPIVLDRSEFKKLMISIMYGAREATLVRRQGMSSKVAGDCVAALERILAVYHHWSDQYLQKAYSNGRVTSLDWQMLVHPGIPTRTVRNWPIQAAGADILRRVCLKLDEAHIPVVGCLHDSVMIEVPIADHEATIQQAQSLMGDASADVLEGFRLKTKVESVVFPPSPKRGGSSDV